MLERLLSLFQQASLALETNDPAALEQLCRDAQDVQPGEGPLTAREMAQSHALLSGLRRQIELAGNNLRVRQALLQHGAKERITWEP